MSRPPTIPAEKKLRIVLSVLQGEITIAEAARREKVSEQAIGNWKRQFLEGGKAGIEAGKSKPSTREQQLEDEVAELTQALGEAAVEIRVWKKSAEGRLGPSRTALRELGRLQRTRFILDWLQTPDLRRRTTAGLNKGEARNALARAVFFNRLGEIRDRSYEHQRYRASGLNLITAAIVLWNTVYLDRATTTLTTQDPTLDPALFRHLSPLGWEHINLTGNYTWRNPIKPGRYRTLRPTPKA